MKLKILILITVMFTTILNAQDAEKEISQMLSTFVKNLNDLNLEPFIESFANDATIFYPRNAFPIERVMGKEAIKKEFKNFFDNVRKSRTGPPFLNIVPRDRQISLYGNIAVVSLHFDLGEEFHRRTIILENSNDKWLINHIHASFLVDKKQ